MKLTQPLMLSAINVDKTYHDQIDMIVCDQKSNICMINMINRCKFFSGVSDARKHLKEQCQLTGEQNKDVSSDADENRTRDFAEEEESQPSLSNNGFQLTMSVFFLRNDHQ